MSECKVNNWVTDGVTISIQVVFVFAFLTMFFFVYVQELEKMEFVSQTNLIIDDIMKDFEEKIPILINKQSLIGKENVLIIINGLIDVLQEKMSNDSVSTVKDILEKNHAVKLKALKSLMSVIIILVVASTVPLLIGFCLPIQYQIKEAMLIIIFVGLTEFIFLQVIAKQFISADPNKIRREIGKEVHNWIKRNK